MHLLFELHANLSIADAMRLVKTNSSKWIRETLPEQRDFAWQTGYAAFSVSASAIKEVTRYIANQDQHHQTRTFDGEFAEFVRRHGFEFDARHFGD